MAQIKKLQKGGTPEKTTPKYGRLIQNGIEFQANDDMIGWLAKQGYYGEQMANNLRRGDDQYLDTDEQGVGWIRDISAANPDLKEKQQEKTTRAGRRIEGRRLNQARADIQRLATYDYSKFAPQPTTTTPYAWNELVIDYNKTKDENGKEVLTYSANSPENFAVEQRLKALSDGLIIPEGQELKNRDDILAFYNTNKHIFDDQKDETGKVTTPGLITRMKTGQLTEADWDALRGLNIVQTGSKQSAKEVTPEEAVTTAVTDWLTNKLNFNQHDAKTHSSYWTVDNNGNLIATKELAKLIGSHNNYWFDESSPYSNYVLLNGQLVAKMDQAFTDWLTSSAGQQFKTLYNQGQWANAAQLMGFKGSDTNWSIYNSQVNHAPFLQHGEIYRDVSPYYMYPEGENYQGAFEVLGNEFDGYGLRKRVTYHIDPDYNRQTLSGITPYTTIVSPERSIPIFQWKNDAILVDTKNPNLKIKIVRNQNGTYNVYYVSDGKEQEIDLSTLISHGYLKEDEIANIPAIIRAASSSRRFKNGGILKYQPGGYMIPNTKQTEQKAFVADITSNPMESVKHSEVWKPGLELNNYDKAEIASLGADAIGLLATFVPGYGNVAGAGAGVASSLANLYASQRDGFQWSDLGMAAGDLGLTLATLIPGAGTAAVAAKFSNGIRKTAKLIGGLFTAYGLYDGINGLTNVLSGDFDMQDLRSVANGLMAIRGVWGNRKANKAVREHGTKKGKSASTTPDVKPLSPAKQALEQLEKTDKRKYEEVSKKIIDELLGQHPEWKSYNGQPNSWYDATSDTVKSYSDAMKGLMDKIPDELIKSNVSSWKKLAINAQQAKETAVNTGKSVGKKAIDIITESFTTPDLQDYVRIPGSDTSNVTNQDLRNWLSMMPRSQQVTVNKKGGKIKKCDDGLKLPTFNKPRGWNRTIDDLLGFPQIPQQPLIERYIPTHLNAVKLKFSNETAPEFQPKTSIFDSINQDFKETVMVPLQIPKTNQEQTDPQNNRQLDHNNDVAGKGDRDKLLQSAEKAAALLAPVFGLANTLQHNNEIKNIALKGIRDTYNGMLKSSPIQQPYLTPNLNPGIDGLNRQKADARTAVQQNKTSDPRLQAAQQLALEDMLAKAETDFWAKASENLSKIDMENANRRYQYAKDEQAVSDYNRQISGKKQGEEANAMIQHLSKQGQEIDKFVAETRTDLNKYLAATEANDLFKQYKDSIAAAERPGISDEQKKKLLERAEMLAYMIKQGTTYRSPLTGKSALSV